MSVSNKAKLRQIMVISLSVIDKFVHLIIGLINLGYFILLYFNGKLQESFNILGNVLKMYMLILYKYYCIVLYLLPNEYLLYTLDQQISH